MANNSDGLPLLNFVGHGTDGSDGIDPGIHLRWAYPTKLGYPPNGAQLWKWDAPSKELMDCFQSIPDVTSQIPPIISEVFPGSWDTSWTAYFKCLADRVEITLDILVNTDFYILLFNDKDRPYEPYHVHNLSPQTKKFVFVDEGIRSVIIVGKGIKVIDVCYYCCKSNSQKNWVKVPSIYDWKLPLGFNDPKLELIYQTDDSDYGVALIRMGVPGPMLPAQRSLKPEDWAEMKPLLEQVGNKDGVTVPVSWSIPPDIETSGDPENGIPAFDSSSHDILNLASLDPGIAKALGMYYIDTAVPSGIQVDYKLEVSYPPDHLANLESQFTFDDFDPFSTLGSDIVLGQALLKDLFLPSLQVTSGTFSRTAYGINYQKRPFGPEPSIWFSGDIREVQLFVNYTGASLELKARRASDPQGSFPLSKVYTGGESILHLSGELIEEVQLIGSGITLFRVHYDAMKLSGIQLVAHVCGLGIESPLPFPAPENLVAAELPAGPTYDENFVRQSDYLGGLRWTMYRNLTWLQLPQAGFRFQVQRKDPGATTFDLVTIDPLVLPMPANEVYAPPVGWPAKPQFFLDSLSVFGTYEYRIRALDIFGRISPASNIAGLVLTLPAPPPPVNLHAKYLDIATRNTDGSVTDPHMTQPEIDWLNAKLVSGIHVEWEWTTTQDEVGSGPANFQIHFEKGWLNMVKGTVESSAVETVLTAAMVSLPAWAEAQYPTLSGLGSYDAYIITVELERAVAADDMAFCMLKQGYQSYLILKHDAGTTVDLWVQKPNELAGGIPLENKSFSVSMVPQSLGFVDYAKAVAWTDLSVLGSESYVGIGKYEAYLSNPAFPNPVFVSNEEAPIRYAQIGVSTVNTEGAQSGVTTPAAIVAVNRTKPDALDPGQIDYGTAKASPPNVHGKSSYAYRWNKQGNGMTYFVSRALDSTLWMTDLSAAESPGVYETWASSKSIGFVAGVTFQFSSAEDYAALDSNQKWVVANMDHNTEAFSRIHSNPIDENDADFENRLTDTPGVGIPTPSVDSNKLLYFDEELDGQGANSYFYRIQTQDVAGNLSEFSETTIPVEVPLILPPVKPSISTIVGGEKEIAVQWEQKAHPGILGYNLYRTDDATKAGDHRRMEWIKGSPSDAYTVTGGGDLEYTDADVLGRKTYFYGVLALMEDENGNVLRSQMSIVREGQAWDSETPVLSNTELIYSIDYEEDEISLSWVESNGEYDCELSRSPGWDDGLSKTMIYNSLDGQYEWLDEGVDLALAFQYQITVRSSNGQEADVKIQAQIIP